VRDTCEAAAWHWRKGTINWPMGVYITLVHVAAVIGLMKVQDSMWQTRLLAFILWPIS
jgi:stearoyl-CoA desaturase (Delta-9 desaturase)